jgi:hypothetical protein
LEELQRLIEGTAPNEKAAPPFELGLTIIAGVVRVAFRSVLLRTTGDLAHILPCEPQRAEDWCFVHA